MEERATYNLVAIPASHRLPREVLLLIFKCAFDSHQQDRPLRCLYQLLASNWCRYLSDHDQCNHRRFQTTTVDRKWFRICPEVMEEYLCHLARTQAVLFQGRSFENPDERSGLWLPRFHNAEVAAKSLHGCLRPRLDSDTAPLPFVDQPDLCSDRYRMRFFFRRRIRTIVLSMGWRTFNNSWFRLPDDEFGATFQAEGSNASLPEGRLSLSLSRYPSTMDHPAEQPPLVTPWTDGQKRMVARTLRDELVWPLKVDWGELPNLQTLCLDLHAHSSGEVPESVIETGAERMKGMRLSKLIVCGLMSYSKYIPEDHWQWCDHKEEPEAEDEGRDENGDEDAHDLYGTGKDDPAVPFEKQRVFGSADFELPMRKEKRRWHRRFKHALRPGGSIEFLDFPSVTPHDMLYSL